MNPHNAGGHEMGSAHVQLGAARLGESGSMGLQHATALTDDEEIVEINPIKAATGRLIAALDALEAAAERRTDADRGSQSLASQVQSLGVDRSKLAAQLDTAVARSRRLEATNREIARRLSLAIESIRSVLEGRDR